MAVIDIKIRTTRKWGEVDSIIKNIQSGVARASYDAARGIAASARRRAPVDTGFLRDSIRTEKISVGRYRIVVGAQYGAYVEYGTRNHPAQPFFKPAVEEYRRLYLNSLKRIIHR